MGDIGQTAVERSAVAHLVGRRRPVVVHCVGGGEHRGIPREACRGRDAREHHVHGRTRSWEEATWTFYREGVKG